MTGDKGKTVKICSVGSQPYAKLEGAYYQGGHDSGRLLSRMMVMVLRYELLTLNKSNYGMQGTTPPGVMEVLVDKFGVMGECFASPLNMYHFDGGKGQWLFCSALPDSDHWYGSQGGFLQWKPTRGSFQCNPPFTKSCVEPAVDHIFRLLRSSNEAMSFCFMIPDSHYKSNRDRRRTDFEEFCTEVVVLQKRQHYFYTGNWHQQSSDKQAHWQSPMDTAVFFLQNAAGRERWPATSQATAAIKQSFSELPPPPMRAKATSINYPSYHNY